MTTLHRTEMRIWFKRGWDEAMASVTRSADMPCPHDFGNIQIGACKLGCGAFKHPGGRIEGGPVSSGSSGNAPNPYAQINPGSAPSEAANAVHRAVMAHRR